MPSCAIDFEYQAGFFSTPEMKAVFDEKRRFARWLEIEAALAAAQGELGVIPDDAAREIARAASLDNLDLSRVAAAYKKSRNSVLPVVNELRTACAGGAGEYVHHGITTQDLLDTAQILEMRDGLAIIENDLEKLKGILIRLSREHLDTPMTGRSHGQAALPITFGYKTALWLAEICRHIERFREMKPRLLRGELGGAVGSMAALGPLAFETAELTMKKLGLSWSPGAWHNSRDRVAECTSLLSLVCASCERIANEIFELSRSEVGELMEPLPEGAASSSTMPHKRNPVISQRVCVASRQARTLAQAVTAAMVHQHERDGRCLWSEMLAVPDIFVYTGCAVNYTVLIIDGLEVRTDRMLANLKTHGDALMGEWLMFRLAGALGRGRARAILERIYSFRRQDEDIAGLLRADPEAGVILGEEDYALLARPEDNTGHCRRIAEEIIAAAEKTIS